MKALVRAEDRLRDTPRDGRQPRSDADVVGS